MSASPADVVVVARSYLGIRWRHQGRSRAGVDCVGLIIRILRDLGLSDFDASGYGRLPDGVMMRRTLDQHCVPRVGDPLPGMVALMRFKGAPQHVGIVAPYVHGGESLVHALVTARKVAEHRLDPTWLSRIVALYDLPGVER